MQKIVPSLWFDHVAAEAANFYAEVLPGATVTRTPEMGAIVRLGQGCLMA